MAASITQTSVLPKSASKLYTNTGTSDVIATLNMVSQTATANPKMNVAYSSSSNLSLNTASTADWSLPESIAAAACPISLNESISTQGKNAYGVNIIGDSYGRMRSADLSSSPDPNPGYVGGSQFIDPYYLVSPTSWNSNLTTPAFAKLYSNQLNFWWDFKAAFNGASSFQLLFGNSPSYNSGQAVNPTASYYDYGGVYDPYTATCISVASNSYVTIRQIYWSAFGGTATGSSGNRSSDSFLYNQVSSGWSSYRLAQVKQPWATDFHADNGKFIVDCSTHPSKTIIFLNLGANFNLGTQTSSPENYTSSSKGVRIILTTTGTLRWLKYNPTTEKWYVYIGGDDLSTGLYSFDLAGEYTTSTSGNDEKIEAASMFLKETSFNFPDEKMTCPARIGATTWLSYTSAGVAYYSNDLITWTLATTFDSFTPTDYTMRNAGSDGINYYGKKGSDVIKTVSSGFSGVDKAGWLEHNTEIGRYERTGIIIPKGQSVYLENIDSLASVSASLLTMDI